MRAGLIDMLEVNAVEQNKCISVLVNMFLNVHSGLNWTKLLWVMLFVRYHAQKYKIKSVATAVSRLQFLFYCQ